MIFLPIGVESMEITRGDIFIADLNPVQGSEQGGVRPVLVIQNDRGNRFSPTVICAAMTSRVTCVAERTTSASYSGMASMSSSVDIFSLTSTCKPFSARRSKPACASFSVTRTFFVMRKNHPSCCVRIRFHTTQRASSWRIRDANIRRKADSRKRMRENVTRWRGARRALGHGEAQRTEDASSPHPAA